MLRWRERIFTTLARLGVLTGHHGALAGSSDIGTDGRASSLGGHLGGQTRGENTGGGHCDDGCEGRVWC